jgi:hypothetical protein
LLLTTITGHLPRRPDEVTLGASTLRLVGSRVGSTVRIRVPTAEGRTRESAYKVVGTSAFPPDFGAGGLGTGAVFTLDGLETAQCGSGRHTEDCRRQAVANGTILIKVAPGAAGQRALGSIGREYPTQIEYPMPPNDLVNFGQAVNFPLILSVIVALFGAATLAHVLVVSVARRRRESGILKTLGFVRRQVAFTVAWQTTTVGLVGVVAGVQLGIALGRYVWREFAKNLGVVSIPVVSGAAMGVVVLGTLVVAAALAVWPARMAAGSPAGTLLREE